MNEMELFFLGKRIDISCSAHCGEASGMSFAIGSDTIIRTEQIDFPKTKKRVKSHASRCSPSCTVIMRLELGRTLTHHWKVAFITFLFFSSQVHGAFITAAHIRTIIQWQTG